MTRYPIKKLADLLAEPTRNGVHKAIEFQGTGTPIVKMGEVFHSPYVEETARDLLDLSTSELEKAEIRDGDLLFCRTSLVAAGVGKCALVRNLVRPTSFASNLIRVRIDSNKADHRYVHFVFRSPLGEQLRTSIARGTSVTTITGPDLASLEIPVPALAEQRAIAGVLGALDDKIDSNRRLIQLADQSFMAEMSMLLSTESSKEFAPLAKVGSIALGGTPSKARSEFWDSGDIPWINSGSLHEKPVITPANHITSLGLQKSATKLIPAGATLFAITGATLGVISRLSLAMTINQSIIAIWSDVSKAWNDYIYFALRTGRDQILSSATGAAQQHVNKSNFEDFELLVPSDRSISKIAELRPLLELQDSASLEARRLSQIRDTLLPELLSGRIRVRDAKSIVEDAL